MEERVVVLNAEGEKLDARLHLPKKKTNKACIIMHGLEGDKDLVWLHAIADKVTEEGIAAVRFDFSGHGDSEGRFKDFGFHKGRADLESIILEIKSRGYDQLAIIGHSIGGTIGLLSVLSHPEVKCLVDIAGPALLHLPNHDKLIKKIYGDLGIQQGMLLREPHTLDILKEAEKVKIPTLLIQGTEDRIVSLDESKKVFERLQGEKHLEIIKGADHILIEDAPIVIKLATEWVMKHL